MTGSCHISSGIILKNEEVYRRGGGNCKAQTKTVGLFEIGEKNDTEILKMQAGYVIMGSNIAGHKKSSVKTEPLKFADAKSDLTKFYLNSLCYFVTSV